jgi:hypothetical protein
MNTNPISAAVFQGARRTARCVSQFKNFDNRLTPSNSHLAATGWSKPSGVRADRFCIGGTILVALNVGLHMGWRPQLHLMPERGQLNPRAAKWGAVVQAAMPTRRGCDRKEGITPLRHDCLRTTTFPCASMTWTWNQCLTKSRPGAADVVHGLRDPGVGGDDQRQASFTERLRCFRSLALRERGVCLG